MGTGKWFLAGTAPGSRDMGRQGEAAAPRKTVGGGIRTIPCHPLQCLPPSKPLISSPTHHSLIPKATGPGHDSTPWQLHLHSRRIACALQAIYNKQARNECPTLLLSGRWTAQLGKEKASLHAHLPSSPCFISSDHRGILPCFPTCQSYSYSWC